jgi:hypothetical protein
MKKQTERKVSAPINAPQVKRGDPNFGKKAQKRARSEKIGKAMCRGM